MGIKIKMVKNIPKKLKKDKQMYLGKLQMTMLQIMIQKKDTFNKNQNKNKKKLMNQK